MTEDKIDRIVELEMNKLERMFAKGILTNEEYEDEVRELDNTGNGNGLSGEYDFTL